MNSESPVVAAVVTSRRGMLVGRRVDGLPPWAFIGGKIEPGESAADAAEREVAEEVGLAVKASEVEIGRRVHPTTQRQMIYVACQPVGDLDAQVCDPSLAEVRGVDLAQTQVLLPGLFPPVLEHLQRALP
jgi:8-oxo-dGTP pyrophosphatase MutT (NUDIX family)